MKKISIVLGILVLLFSVNSVFLNAESPTSASIYNGNEYIKCTLDSRIQYVAGIYDMWIYLVQKNNPQDYELIINKVDGITIKQLTKIFDNYYENHPENLHYSCASIFDYVFTDLIVSL